MSDSATYTCIASNRAGVDNRHYNLQVHGESEVVAGSSLQLGIGHRDDNAADAFLLPSVPPGLDGAGSTDDVTVVRGNSASLLCVPDGTPTPTVSWLKDGDALYPEPHLKFTNLNTSVQFIPAQVNDTGRYSCVADNAAGQASRHFNLKVLGECQTAVHLSSFSRDVSVNCKGL